jgi:hypothetical protein
VGNFVEQLENQIKRTEKKKRLALRRLNPNPNHGITTLTVWKKDFSRGGDFAPVHGVGLGDALGVGRSRVK